MRTFKSYIYLLLAIILLFSTYSCQVDSNKSDEVAEVPNESKFDSRGIAKSKKGTFVRDENGNVIDIEDKESKEGGEKKDLSIQEELIENKNFNLSEEKKEQIVAGLSSEAKDYYHRVELRGDTMFQLLSLVITELEKKKPIITKLDILERNFYEVSERFDEDKSKMRGTLEEEFKTIYSLTAFSMDAKLRKLFIAHKKLLKQHGIPNYNVRSK